MRLNQGRNHALTSLEVQSTSDKLPDAEVVLKVAYAVIVQLKHCNKMAFGPVFSYRPRLIKLQG